ncbi:hypothetical protein FOA52_009269 [Chlamydomonas sp. UWO 241]|nr:hypothetical protein FOA52_009269 [Chlamydomonas sp. UWO 241]
MRSGGAEEARGSGGGAGVSAGGATGAGFASTTTSTGGGGGGGSGGTGSGGADLTPLLHRDASGFLSTQVLMHQVELYERCMGELCGQVLMHQVELYERCMEELCGQVGSICLERGFLIHQLWGAGVTLLKAALADRDTAWQVAITAKKQETDMAAEVDTATASLRTERDEMAKLNESLTVKLMARAAETEEAKAKTTELQRQIAALAGVSPELLVATLSDSKSQLVAAEKHISSLTARLAIAGGDATVKDRELQHEMARAMEAKLDADAAATALGSRSPRPDQPAATLPWDVLSLTQREAATSALREGCSPEDMHRLLLGRSSGTGFNVMPWFDALAGAARFLDPTQPGTLGDLLEEMGDGYWGGGGRGAGGDSLGEERLGLRSNSRARSARKPLTREASLRQRDDTASIAGAQSTMSLGGGRLASPGKRRGIGGAHSQQHPPRGYHEPTLQIQELHTFLRNLIAKDSVPALAEHLPEHLLTHVAGMRNRGADAETIVCLLVGVMSFGGYEVSRCRELAGALAASIGSGVDEVGGPITRALAAAKVATAVRVLDLEKSVLLQRRRAAKAERAPGEVAAAAAEAAREAEQRECRKLSRPPHPMVALTSQPFGTEYFAGLGTGDEVPEVLRASGKVRNMHMGRDACLKAVRALWVAKAEADAVWPGGNAHASLPDFMAAHYSRKYGRGRQGAIAEAAYNLFASAAHHASVSVDPELSLFGRCFRCEVEATMADEQARMCASLLEALSEHDAVTNLGVCGWMDKAALLDQVRALHPYKSDAALYDLSSALDADEPGCALVRYLSLFDDDDGGQQSVFSDVLRRQYVCERLRAHQATENAVLEAAERGGGPDVSPAMLSTAVSKAHPGADARAQAAVLARVFGDDAVPAGRGSKGVGVPLERALVLLRCAPVSKVEAQSPQHEATTGATASSRSVTTPSGEGAGDRREAEHGGEAADALLAL